MPESSQRGSAVKNAIDDITRRLSALPQSPASSELRERAAEYRREVDDWKTAQPPANGKEHLMRRVLQLHTDVAALERNCPKKPS